VPIWRRDHRFAGAKSVCQRSRRDLGFVEVGCYVKVCGADELLQVLKIDEPVVEDDVFLYFVLLGKFPGSAGKLHRAPQFIRMGGAEDNINNIAGNSARMFGSALSTHSDALVRRAGQR
jgi:hypothetical protein